MNSSRLPNETPCPPPAQSGYDGILFDGLHGGSLARESVSCGVLRQTQAGWNLRSLGDCQWKTASMSELAIELYAGLHGWGEGLIAAGFRVVGFDIVDMGALLGEARHERISLVLQDVRTLCGAQFKNARLIVASPPCQEFSYMAMPWSRAKQIEGALRGLEPFPEGYTGSRTVAELTALFDACFRIQREASEAAGRYIPMVVENVRGAQKWVGQAKANFGSYYLWGDVGMVGKRVVAGVPQFGVSVQPMKVTKWGEGQIPGKIFSDRPPGNVAAHRELVAQKRNPDGTDHGSGSWFKIADSQNRGAHGRKQAGISGERSNGKGDKWFQDGAARHGSKSNSRKAASAQIARIPYPLALYVAQAFTADGKHWDGWATPNGRLKP